MQIRNTVEMVSQ